MEDMMSAQRGWTKFRAGSFPLGTTHPRTPEAVKKLGTGGDREGEAPAEPHGARTCWGGGSPGGSPSQFSHSFPPAEGNQVHPYVVPIFMLCGADRAGMDGFYEGPVE